VSDKLLTRSPNLSVLRAAGVTLPPMLSELLANALVMKVLHSITLILNIFRSTGVTSHGGIP